MVEVTAKFMNDYTAVCLRCLKPLKAQAVTKNPRHLYTIGTLFVCFCGKSRVWTNSIRNPAKLLSFFEGKSSSYTNGFCNDKFDGFTLDEDQLRVLEGGVEVPGYPEVADRLGNPKTDNNQIAWWFNREWEANNQRGILDWYQTHQSGIVNLMAVSAAFGKRDATMIAKALRATAELLVGDNPSTDDTLK